MTNQMIILENSIRLAKEGVLKYTGREYKFSDSDGKEHVIKEVEPIHTYNGWKELGFQVQKGQKARCQFVIWKYAARKKTEDMEVEPEGKMFMKRASFFTQEQVERVAE